MNPLSLIKYGKYFSNAKFINFVSNIGKNLAFIRKALVLFYCIRDDDTPKYIKAILAGALGYLILPTDMMPDTILGFGWIDDLAVITMAYKIAGRYIKSEHREKAKNKLPFGEE